MAVDIGRREFVAGLSGVAASWPLTARAQQPMPVIGFMHTASADRFPHLVAAFRVKVSTNSVLPRLKMSLSNIAGQKGITSGCPSLPLS